jgi:hypothetical protein
MENPPPASDVSPAPRFYSNGVHIAMTGYDLTITFLEGDPTILPDDQVGPHSPVLQARVQVTMALGCAKALIPGLVKAISQYEQQFGMVPAPGFEEDSKS